MNPLRLMGRGIPLFLVNMENQETPKFKLGDDIDAYCKRCRLNLNASVTALNNGEVVQVFCRTCFTTQPYKPPVNVAEKRKKALERVLRMRDKKIKGEQKSAPENPDDSPVKEIPKKPENMWDEMMKDFDFRKGKPYDASRNYQMKDFLLHKIHGVGIVVNLVDEKTIQVLFKNSLQNLPQSIRQEN
jgi:hypothetical protein